MIPRLLVVLLALGALARASTAPTPAAPSASETGHPPATAPAVASTATDHWVSEPAATAEPAAATAPHAADAAGHTPASPTANDADAGTPAVPASGEPASEASAGPAAKLPLSADDPAPALAPTSAHTVAHEQIAHAATAQEVTSLLRIGQTKRDQGDFVSAEIAFLQVLAEAASPEQDREALLGLARTYRKKGDFTKSTAVYERFIQGYPGDAELPAVYLELGRTLRALGAYKQAMARFYSVLNSTLKLPDDGAEVYRQLARTAQFEIAETYFQTADYAQANRFFSRLKLLDLAPEDRARAHFKSVFALTLAGQNDQAVTGLLTFLDQNPDDENVPEARYLLSVTLRRLGRTQESLQATLDLLKVESRRTERDPRRWGYWQRKTGNQLANEFYQSGDISSALLVYQSLAALSSDPSWHLPATYQIGLCYERLRQFERAQACYQTIVDKMKAGSGEASPRPDLADLAEMAAWRLGQLAWQKTTESQLSAIFTTTGSNPPATPNTTSASVPASASASAHDPHGSAPIASHVVR